MSDVEDLQVRGGAFGEGARIAVDVSRLEALSILCARGAAEIVTSAERVRTLLLAAERDLALAATVAPLSVAVAQPTFVRVGWATVGEPAALVTLGGQLAAAAASYAVAEAAVDVGTDLLDAALVGGLAVGGTKLFLASPPAGAASGVGLATAFVESPWLQKHAINGVDTWLFLLGRSTSLDGIGPGPIHPPFAPSKVSAGDPSGLAMGYAFVASLYRDRAARLGAPVRLADRPAPTGLGDLFARVDMREPGDAENPDGRLVVERRDGLNEHGRPRSTYLVVMPGTSDWEWPWTDEDPDIRDVNAIGRALSGVPNAEVEALPEALHRAGVPDGAAVALLGHSLGGINAMPAAASPAMRRRFQVKHVLTAASPVGRIAVPGPTRVLSLENRKDVVPKGEGEDNPDTARHTTVTFSSGTHDLGDAHEMTAYTRAAEVLDERIARGRVPVLEAGAPEAADRSLRDVDDRLRADGFLAEPGGSGAADTSDTSDTVEVTRLELSYADRGRPTLPEQMEVPPARSSQ